MFYLYSIDDYNVIINLLIVSLPLHVLSIMTVVLIQFLNRCKCCKSSCCDDNIQRTLMNVDNPLEQTVFEERMQVNEIEIEAEI